MADPGWTFSEREFYLAEFRGRTLGIALPDGGADDLADLNPVVEELRRNGTRSVLFSPDREFLERAPIRVISARAGGVSTGDLWRHLREDQGVGVLLAEGERDEFAALCRQWVLQLRLAKLVWIDPRGGFHDSSGIRISLADLSDLAELRSRGKASRPADSALLTEIQTLLEGGISSVNFCAMGGLADELFTYSGSGTLFTRERYMDVRRLGIDDFDAAGDLIERGIVEGFLAPRTDAAVREILGRAFGVFVEGRYLAGIGSLIPYAEDRMAEIVSLYTLTRFVGEGVGGYLVRYALETAAAQGAERVFACTSSKTVEEFFIRHGFESLDGASLPASKWEGYPEDRRSEVRCLVKSVA